MCSRDDIVELRHCSFCGATYYGDLGHRFCPNKKREVIEKKEVKSTHEETVK
jgi:predicted nucleic acid-binding Zn ribbon protein